MDQGPARALATNGDVSRWLRYAVPGAIYELLFGTWLYLDDLSCGCYEDLPDVDTAFVAVVAAGTVPIGFIASVMGHQWLWCNRWPLRQIDLGSILKAAGCSGDSDDLEKGAMVDFLLHRYGAEHPQTLSRLRGHADFFHGMAASFASSVAGLLSVVVTLAVKFCLEWRLPNFDNWERIASLGGVLAAGILFGLLFVLSQRRIAKLYEHYARAFFQWQRQQGVKGSG